MRLAYVSFALGSTLALAGCGDSGTNARPDGPPEPSLDGPPAPGAVTVTVTRGSEPQADVEVYFLAPDSSVVAAVRTDAAGAASAVMAPGGSVTAIDPFERSATSHRLYTYAGVEPGDQLSLHEQGELRRILIDVVAPVDPGAARYVLHTSCQQSSYNITAGGEGHLIEMLDCGTADVLLETRDADGAPRKFLVREGFALINNAVLDLTAASYQALPVATHAYTGVPAGITTVALESTLRSARDLLYRKEAAAPVASGGATLTVERPTLPGMRMVNRSAFSDGGFGRHVVTEWGPSGDHALDVTGALLRAYAAPPRFEAGERAIAWRSAATGETPDAVSAVVALDRFESAGQHWRWHLVGPYTGDRVEFPALPGAAATFVPVAGDAVAIEQLRTTKLAGGYDELRADAFADGADHLLDRPTGRVVHQDLVIAGT
ncbi:MAG: hypothetical protein ACTHU0_01225 [Kofleriaceae bacterium]